LSTGRLNSNRDLTVRNIFWSLTICLTLTPIVSFAGPSFEERLLKFTEMVVGPYQEDFQGVVINESPVSDEELEREAMSRPPVEEFFFSIDPKNEPVELVTIITHEDMRQESERMRANHNPIDADVIVIPLSIADEKLLANIDELNQEQLNVFLAKKTRYLNRAAKVLRLIMSKKNLNQVLAGINEGYFENAGNVAASNAFVVSIQLAGAVGLGAGAPKWLINNFPNSRITKKLSGGQGFYSFFGAGLALVKKTENGRNYYSVETYYESRKADEIFSFFGFVALGLGFSMTDELHNSSRPSIETARFLKISIPNIFFGNYMKGLSIPAAIAFPPGGGAIAGMKGELKRYRNNPEGRTAFKKDFLAFWDSAKKSCHAVLKN
jgi:hypothetical protein